MGFSEVEEIEYLLKTLMKNMTCNFFILFLEKKDYKVKYESRIYSF